MAHESNWSGLETLERRKMLSGVTLITHEYSISSQYPLASLNTLAASLVTGPRLGILSGPTSTTAIAPNDTTPSLEDYTDFGLMSTQTGALVRKYTLKNNGDQTLNLTGTKPITISGAGTDFTVVTQPTGSIAPGESKTFEIRFDPSVASLRQATVTIATNDPANPNYRFTIGAPGRPVNTLVSSLRTLICASSLPKPGPAQLLHGVPISVLTIPVG